MLQKPHVHLVGNVASARNWGNGLLSEANCGFENLPSIFPAEDVVHEHILFCATIACRDVPLRAGIRRYCLLNLLREALCRGTGSKVMCSSPFPNRALGTLRNGD